MAKLDEYSVLPVPKPENEEEQDIVLEVKKRFKLGVDWEAEARTRFDYDIKFANADTHNKYQWDNDIINEREGRPCLTINKTSQHNLMIINDAKQNKPGVRIRPVGDQASFEAATIVQEIIYHIEYISNAENVYDNATVWQVQGGIGYWRIVTEFVSDNSFDQEIYIRRIKDPRSVYLDPDINEVDGSDARFAIIFENIPRDLFNQKYKEFASVGSQTLFGSNDDGWNTKDTVRVAEYYRKTEKDDKLVTWIGPNDGVQVLNHLSKLEGFQKEIYKALKASKEAQQLYQFRERKVITDDIEWFKIAGDRIIDRGPWLGKYIPIIRLIGTETVIDGMLDRKGHTRALINAQQIYNYNCLDLDTVLPTPTGWTTIREVNEGDYLLDDKGLPTKVTGISPVNINRKCFNIIFDSGENIIADENHLWTVEERGKAIAGGWQWLNKTITTKELVSKKHFIKVVEPVSLPEAKLPIDPYVLGVWLGDGSTDCNRFTCDILDAKNMIANLSWKGYEIGNIRKINGKSAVDITIHGLRNDLINTKLLGNKYIPNSYLRSSKEQRLALLQGLMDTDGCINKFNNQCIFTNSNARLTSNVIELISSLGIKCKKEIITARARKFPSGEIYNCQEAYRLTFTADPTQPVFKLSRKLDIQQKDRKTHWRRTKRHGIKSIVEIQSVPVKCLTVDAPSKLFLAGEHWIPTHNTSANIEYGALQTKVPWLAPMDAIEGFEEYWKSANTKNHSFLPYNHMDDDGNAIASPSRPQPPTPGPAYVQAMEIAQNEMMMVSGQFQAQFGEQENAKSGVAINARQRQGDRATYHFIDNLGIAVKYTGKILIDLFPKIYDTQRVQRIKASNGSILEVTIDPEAEQPYQKLDTAANPKMDDNKIVTEVIFNPNLGLYDIQADSGPSFATKRMEAVNALTQVAQSDKNFMAMAGDIYFEMMDFPKADIIADRYNKMLPPQLKDQQTDPQVEDMMHKASDHIQQQQAMIADLQQQLKDKTLALTQSGMKIDLEHKKAVATEAREDYKAETDRVVALGNAGPAISIEQLTPVIQQLLQGMITNGELVVKEPADAPGVHEGGTVPGADLASQEMNAGAGESTPEEPQEPEEQPPMAGARRAPDGNYYVNDPNRPGKYLMVNANGAA